MKEERSGRLNKKSWCDRERDQEKNDFRRKKRKEKTRRDRDLKRGGEGWMKRGKKEIIYNLLYMF